MTVAEALQEVRERLRAAGVASAEAEAWLLLEHVLEVTRAELLLGRSAELGQAQQQRLERSLARREAREPLQHILGMAHFYGLELMVSPDALIPRPETEGLVARALERLKGLAAPRVLDVGTGSGAIALALKAERPDAVVWATDLSPKALGVAAANARRLGLEVHFMHSDLLAAPELQDVARTLDGLVSNPPYLPDGDASWLSPEVGHDPPEALFSGPDGLAHFRRLEAQARSLLKLGAVCLFELDPRNVTHAQAASAAWAGSTVHPDLSGRPRYLELVR